jgi:hypothetical protein
VDELAECFLEEEAQVAVKGLDPMDRARFGHLVRQCAANWLLHPQARLRVTRGKFGMALLFDGPMSGKMVLIFSLRAEHAKGEYRFVGPNGDRKKLGLDPGSLEALDRLRDLYDALLGGDTTGEAVQAVLNGDRMPDLVPLVEETRRALDGGQDGGPPAAAERAARKRKSRSSTTRKVSVEKNVSAPVPEKKAEPVPPTVSVTGIRFAAPDPAGAAAFWSRLLKLKPETASDGTASFRTSGASIRITPELSKDERKALGAGQSKALGVGLIPELAVSDFDLCLRRARRMETAVVDDQGKDRHFTVKDPSGFTVRIIEA